MANRNALKWKVSYTTPDGKAGDYVTYAVDCEEAIKAARRSLNVESILATCTVFELEPETKQRYDEAISLMYRELAGLPGIKVLSSEILDEAANVYVEEREAGKTHSQAMVKVESGLKRNLAGVRGMCC
jgi:hypothetical protein